MLIVCLQMKKQATGSDLVIHKTFWFALPGHIKVPTTPSRHTAPQEGFRFSWAKVTCKEYSYQQL